MEREQIIANCHICGKKFQHISSRVNKAKYCSRKCYHKAQIGRGRTTFKCQYCGKNFQDSASCKRKYCSKACVNKCEREKWHPKFTTVRKKMIRENQISECEICGYDEHQNILGIHHKDGNRENNIRNNLQVVCPMCHSLIHKKHISH